ncbi:MAG: glycosyltransferase family 39 protein [Candidatus Heimdallarchaeum endolithica]|uniref:Glycosyltransferase family 39 protein n=1 Tax=Candidatus Heimdallarchaeum endolithica TaxID=2876572 RepID=A0A9Y1FP11_9ARCH|nr:MAG: glycosyltransferase family 39 protein [Candidatus Heimdallarchaeum endolithica]
MFSTVLVTIASILFPCIFLYNHNASKASNIILILSSNIVFNYLMGIIYLFLDIKTLIFYIFMNFTLAIFFIIVNKNLIFTYYNIINNLKKIYNQFQLKQINFLRKLKEKINNIFNNFTLKKSTSFIVLYFIFFTFYHSILFPTTSADAIFTHMPMIKFLYEINSFPYIRDYPFLNYHFFYDISPFHIIGYMLFKIANCDFPVRFLNPIFLTISVLAIYEIFKYFNIQKNSKSLTIIIFISCPALISVSSTMNNDVSQLSFFLTAILFNIQDIKAKYRKKSILLGDIFIGLMICSKQISLVNYIFYLAFRIFLERKFNSKIKKHRVSLSYLYFGPFLTFFIGSIRYVITFINFGEIFYPYTNIFDINFVEPNVFSLIMVYYLFLFALFMTFLMQSSSFLDIFTNIKVKRALSICLSSVVFVCLIVFFRFTLFIETYRKNNLYIISAVNIGKVNQPLGSIIVSLSIIWLIYSIFQRNIEKKFLALYIIIPVLILQKLFVTSSLSRYYLLLLPVLSLVSSEALSLFFKEINSIGVILSKAKNLVKVISTLMKITIVAMLTINVLFSTVIIIFGFKTINDPVLYPILHPFNNDDEDLYHWKLFEIKLIDYVNNYLPRSELIIVYPFEIYYIHNYSRLIFPESQTFRQFLLKHPKQEWFSVLKEKLNIRYIAILNSAGFYIYNIPDIVKEFMKSIQYQSNNLLVIKKFYDTRTFTTREHLYSMLLYIP